MKHRTIVRTGALIAATALVFDSHLADASSNVLYSQGVNNYYSQNANGWGNLPNSIADADNLAYAILSGGSNPLGIVRAPRYMDNSCWTSDFLDSNWTGLADQDNIYFDKPNNAISYFSGHGWTTNGQTGGRGSNEQYCLHNSDCATGTPGAWPLPTYTPNLGPGGFCQRLPGDNFGFCAYRDYNRAIQLNNNLNGPDPVTRNGRVSYTNGGGMWGESPYSGSWAAVDTNGGVNFVGLAISGASNSLREGEYILAFAGVHLIGTTFTHSGDELNDGNRGYYFGISNIVPSSSIATGWRNAINSLAGPVNGTYCGDYYAHFPQPGHPGNITGGGKGHSQCGGHQITARGATQAEANTHLYESWTNIKDDNLDGKGRFYYASLYTCNYDCVAWPFDIQ